MDQHDESDELQALQSLDPAAGLKASDALRDRITAIADVEVVAPRRNRWLAPVAAAAALVVGVGGGYAFGTGAFELHSDAVAGAPIPIITGTTEHPGAPVSLGSGTNESSIGAAEGGALSESKGMTAGPQGGQLVSSPFSQNRRFIVPEFDDAASTAAVYAIDASTHYSEAGLARIAAALGITGSSHRGPSSYGWGADNGHYPGPAVQIIPTGDAGVSYSTGLPEPWTACHDNLAPYYDLNNNNVHAEFMAGVEQCVVATPMPTEQAAREALSAFLIATDIDEAETQVTVYVDEKSRTISATAAWVIEGNATRVTSSATVSAAGVLGSHGASGTVVPLGEYNIVSPAEAAARLNDRAFSPTFTSGAVARVDSAEYPIDYQLPTEPPAVPLAGADIPWGISEFTIESGRLGLATVVGTNDERFLVPAYEFTDTEGNMWSIIALAEDELDSSGRAIYGDGWWGY